jgi:uncharacterized protein (TIGR03437 family)
MKDRVIKIAGSKLFSLSVVFSCIALGRIHSGNSKGALSSPAGRTMRIEDFGGLPLRFEVNRGQADPQTIFLCRAAGYGLLLTSTGAVMSLSESFLTIRFAESAPNARIEGIDTLPGTTNYFIGNDPKQWRTNVPSYGRVKYGAVYPGIDLIYRENGRNVEYDFVVAPGADPGRIRVSFEGARKIEVNEAGDLVLDTPSGPVIQRRPEVWQAKDGERRKIRSGYVKHGPTQIAIAIGSYDPALPLIIDPELVYATYLGGSNLDFVAAVATGPNGDVYVAGSTSGPFPVTPGAFQVTPQDPKSNTFVARLNASGSALIYATYIGSSGATSLTVDGAGNAYVAGGTSSAGFPTTPGAFQNKPGGRADAFVAKVNAAGTALIYSTYLGGNGDEAVGSGAIAIDSQGNAYVTGSRTGTDNQHLCLSSFPVTPNVFRGGGGWCDGFLAALNPSGTGLIFATDVGGQHIALDQDGNIYVTGWVGSPGFIRPFPPFPTTAGAFRTTCKPLDTSGDGDSFIVKLNATANTLLYSACLAGDIDGLAVDAAGNAYVAGTTTSSDFTTTAGSLRADGNRYCDAELWGNSPFHPPNLAGGLCEIFVTKVNAAGTGLVYSTYVAGADPFLMGIKIALDAQGNAYIAGSTAIQGDTYNYGEFPTTSGSFPAAPNWTGFLAKLNAGGTALIDSTRIPSSLSAQALAVDVEGNTYLAGTALEHDNVSATPGVLQTAFAGGPADGFVSKVHLRDSPIIPAFDSSGVVNAASFLAGPIAPGELITIFGSGFGPLQLAPFQLDRNGRVDSLLGGTRVLFDGIPSPMVYATQNQLTAVVPYALASKTSTQLQVEYLGNKSNPVTLPVAPAAPGIFTWNASGTGQGAIMNAFAGEDPQINSPANPVDTGSEIYVYVTGAGQTDPPGMDGAVTTTVMPVSPLAMEARIGGVKANIPSVLAAAGTVSGVLEVNIRIPPGISAGDAVPIVLLIGGASTQAGVTLAVR